MSAAEWWGTAVIAALWGLLILSLWWRDRTRHHITSDGGPRLVALYRMGPDVYLDVLPWEHPRHRRVIVGPHPWVPLSASPPVYQRRVGRLVVLVLGPVQR